MAAIEEEHQDRLDREAHEYYDPWLDQDPPRDQHHQHDPQHHHDDHQHESKDHKHKKEKKTKAGRRKRESEIMTSRKHVV